jgi:SpoVK/Ycf46/Vps4 family AAA+-type ATPase
MDFAPRFLDCPISATEPGSLKDKILEKLVKPLRDAAPTVSKGQKLPDEVPVSAILFGPPGTSKTEIVEQISDFVGWPVFSVDPSYFVRNGLDAIQSQANNIFRMLAACEEIVVLFDEFDEMVRNREHSDELLSRFLTTAMLPKLAKINKQRRILFLVATNYIDSFDVAISRAGRFDYVIQMMPPNAHSKLNATDNGPTTGWKDNLSWIKTRIASDTFDNDLGDLTFLAGLFNALY